MPTSLCCFASLQNLHIACHPFKCGFLSKCSQTPSSLRPPDIKKQLKKVQTFINRQKSIQTNKEKKRLIQKRFSFLGFFPFQNLDGLSPGVINSAAQNGPILVQKMVQKCPSVAPDRVKKWLKKRSKKVRSNQKTFKGIETFIKVHKNAQKIHSGSLQAHALTAHVHRLKRRF